MGLHQTRMLPHREGHRQQNESHPMEQGKIFATTLADKGSISKIYKEPIQYKENPDLKNELKA